MNRKLATGLVFALLLLSSAWVVFAYGPAPSWQLTQAAAGVCSDDDVFIAGMEINVPAPMHASELGTYSAPGFPNLGYTQDSNFQGVGVFDFTVFTDPYVLPANTQVTLSVTTYKGPNYTGGVAYVSTMTWDCTTGVISSLVNEAPTDACPSPLPGGAVLGEAPAGAQVYWGPSADKASPGVVLNPGTYYVIGVDATGAYTQVWLTCESPLLWVRSDTLQPSYTAPWNGQALPTKVVG